jgi:hypothetical protein
MTNNKQQTAVGWFSNQAHELFEQYSEGKFDRITLNKLMLEATEQAKEMEKWQIKETASAYFHENTKLTPTQYYEQTYGKNHIGDVNKMVGGEQ